jgi:hypothetical protein
MSQDNSGLYLLSAADVRLRCIVRLAEQLPSITATARGELSRERSANSDAQQGFRLDTLDFWHCSEAGNEATAPTHPQGGRRRRF